jgi:valyl-tRNA synthetase
VIQILDKRYDPGKIEGKWQERWKEEGIYKFNIDSGKPIYSLDTPPPFTSGTLHMGHIYNHVWIDIVARYKRMRGFEVYFPQGFDCHGLPTELRVEKELGVKKENREEFLEMCEDWTRKSIDRMRGQFDQIGYSTDWNHTYWTMDDSYKKLVQKTLLIFYERGLLYREKHPVLWCPNCGTALAKAEVGHIEREGKLYHIDLDVEEHKLTIATTRPEMMPACVAVFVHPGDGRYEKFVGKKATLPLFGKEVPVLSDEAVDPEFGTGVVYLCTFGDEQDIAWQKKYKLPVIEAIDKNGNLTKVAGKYAGLGIKDARTRITEDLVEKGYIRKIEKLLHQVTSHTERGSCKAPIELLPLKQWFINVRDFIQDVIKAAEEMKWYPGYMLQRLTDWSNAMDWDWIISRQRVFGTPIPFWICGCGEVIQADERELPVDPRGTTRKCPKCGGKAKGEKDVCDCWIDSSVTPLIISKWLESDSFFKKTYPSSLRPQGYEIIRTWTFYTIYRNLVLTGKPCFRDLLINGMVAGPDGRKMSKSLGNVIEPEEPLKRYSADTIRQWASIGTLGDDYPFSWEECEHSQRFLTKLWNISRFIESHLQDFDGKEKMEFTEADRWILSKLQGLIEECTKQLDSYVFNIPLERIRSFIWHDLADNYLEMVKHRLYKPETYGEESRRAAQYSLNLVLKTIIKLLSPFTPHICDEIWSSIFEGCATISEWPEADKDLKKDDSEETGEILVEIIAEIRRHKSENKLPLGSEIENVEILVSPELEGRVEKIMEDIAGTGKIKNLKLSVSDVDRFMLSLGG